MNFAAISPRFHLLVSYTLYLIFMALRFSFQCFIVGVIVCLDRPLVILLLLYSPACFLKRKKSSLRLTTAVLSNFIHFAVLYYYEDVQVAHFRQLNALLYQIPEPLALQIDPLEPVLNAFIGFSW